MSCACIVFHISGLGFPSIPHWHVAVKGIERVGECSLSKGIIYWAGYLMGGPFPGGIYFGGLTRFGGEPRGGGIGPRVHGSGRGNGETQEGDFQHWGAGSLSTKVCAQRRG